MSDSGEKRHGFERWVASLKLESLKRPPQGEEDSLADPDNTEEQATLVKRLPKEMIYRLRERESNRVPKNEESTAIFVPPPELLVRAKRLDAPPKPSVAPEAAQEEPTRLVRSDPMQVAPSDRAVFRSQPPPRPGDPATSPEEEPTRIHSSAEPDVAAELAAIDRLTSQPPFPPGSPGAAANQSVHTQKTPIAAFSAFNVPSLETPSDAPPPAEPDFVPTNPPTTNGAGWVAFAVALLVLAVLLVAVVR